MALLRVVRTAWLTPRLTLQVRGYASAHRVEGQYLPRKTSIPYTFSKDPYLFAQKIERIIKSDKLNDAIALTMNAPSRLQSVVIWNHLIRACAKQGFLKKSTKLFSQIKKRGLIPNVKSYTLVLEACANSTSPNVVTEAEAYFDKLKQTLSPNLTHFNALLKVYLVSGQVDKAMALFERMPRMGPQASDCRTYTMVIKALADQALLPASSSPPAKSETSADVSKHPRITFDQVVAMWDRMRDDQQQRCLMNQHNKTQTPPIQLTSHLVNSILHACNRTNDPRWFRTGVQLAADAYGFSKPSRSTAETAPLLPPTASASAKEAAFDSKTFNLLLLLCIRAGQFSRGRWVCAQALEHFRDTFKPTLLNHHMCLDMLVKETQQLQRRPA
ncbi:hypothetical protein H4R34_001310 [Dimargaris verticillata]|uniref:Pentacotripeptide-repeat region of PRORP domain-containing protein n=1 Tax=Dimargaris verticillata TaxID=2761393 RepID=A0A9W8BBP2_9FUNG|nr:hypothetical protein H4R34_001310 [Dimargaris verticillata]